MRAAGPLSNREARWLALRAQGLGGSRSGSGRAAGPAGFRRQLAALSTIQLDAVNVLARTQLLVPFSRLGAYDPALLHGLTGPGRPWFEYWGHAASIQPVELYPLLRARMHQSRTDVLDSPVYSARRQAFRAANAGYLDAIRREVAERGPLAASQLSDPRRRAGEWWDRRSDGRRALEFLFSDGEVAAWRTPAFERVYDLPDRVLPPAARSRRHRCPTSKRPSANSCCTPPAVSASGRWATWPTTSRSGPGQVRIVPTPMLRAAWRSRPALGLFELEDRCGTRRRRG